MKTILDLIKHQCVRNKMKAALGEPSHFLTYSQLWDQINYYSEKFIQSGIEPGDIFIVFGTHKIETVSQILAIFNTNAIFFPLDYTLPSNRIQTILKSLRPKAIYLDPNIDSENLKKIKKTSNIAGYSNFKKENLYIRKIADRRFSKKNRYRYIFATSGSTGDPKLFLFDDRSYFGFFQWVKNNVPLGTKEIFAAISPLHFDLVVFEIFLPLCLGHTVALFPRETRVASPFFEARVKSSKVSVLQTSSSLLKHLQTIRSFRFEALASIKKIFLTAEQVNLTVASQLKTNLPKLKLYNLYGQTEANSYLIHQISNRDIQSREIPIGNISQCAITLRNKELIVTGEHVYASTIDLVHRKITKNRTRTHRTGDICEFDKKGRIFFMGRKSRFVKRMGSRISLDLVEKEFLISKQFTSCACIQNENDQIILFYSALRNVNLKKMISRLSLKSDELPNFYFKIASIPTKSNGKTDYGKLKEIWKKRY